jgi:glycosyltransferase involved in cell wall biosynthesis
MRILYITNGFPYPLTSGYLRHYYLIKELSARHSVTLLSLVGARFSAECAEALAPFTELTLPFALTRERSPVMKTIGRLRLLAGRNPAVQQMCAVIESLKRKERFDVALLSGKQTFDVLDCLESTPVVVDMCDATSVRIKGAMRHSYPGKLPFLMLELMKVRRVEQLLMRRAAHLLFASCRDREALGGLQSARATVIPNGVDSDFWKRSSPALGTNTIIFSGAMDYAPNTDAALYLVYKILPLVQRVVPGARALIVGRDPAPRLRKAAMLRGVTMTGYVDDVRPYLEQATVFVAPLRFGAGIQNKLLEAMAMEVPVIATALAADGLRTEEDEYPPLRIAEEPSRFAELIVEQLLGRAAASEPDAAARRFVERNFTWRASGKKQEQVMMAVARGASGLEARYAGKAQ